MKSTIIILFAALASLSVQAQSKKVRSKADEWLNKEIWKATYENGPTEAICSFYHEGIFDGKAYAGYKDQVPYWVYVQFGAKHGCPICSYYHALNLLNPRFEFQHRDVAAALPFLKKAGEAGYLKAELELAKIYENEQEFRSVELATQWYRKAAAAGDSLAIVKVGKFEIAAADPFEKGMQAYHKKDYELAVKLWTLAAEYNHDGYAAYNLALLYFNGDGVEQREKEARADFFWACSLGNKDGCYWAGKLYLQDGEKSNALYAWAKGIKLGYPGLEAISAALRKEVNALEEADRIRWAQEDAAKRQAVQAANERFAQQNREFYEKEYGSSNTNYSNSNSSNTIKKRTVCWKCNGRGTIHTTLSDGAVKSGGVVVYGTNESCSQCNGTGFLD